MIRAQHQGQSIWLDRNDLSDKFKYVTWLKYFKTYPKGNEGWTHGYSWGGTEDYLRAEPNDNSAKIVLMDGITEIYLLGEYKDNWAKVKVKEVEQIFGETYYHKSKYFHEWEGWIRLTNEGGFPNLDEIILRC